MKAKEIRDLLDFISNSGLEEVNIETEELKLSVRKNQQPQYVQAPAAQQPAMPSPQAAPPMPAEQGSAQQAASSQPSSGGEGQQTEEEDTDKYYTVKSPMIGTFYNSPTPDADPYVKPGDYVEKGQTLCIIEAMKLFNEIEAEVTGKIVKVLVENSSPVEYDQPLFLIDPS